MNPRSMKPEHLVWLSWLPVCGDALIAVAALVPVPVLWCVKVRAVFILFTVNSKEARTFPTNTCPTQHRRAISRSDHAALVPVLVWWLS